MKTSEDDEYTKGRDILGQEKTKKKNPSEHEMSQ